MYLWKPRDRIKTLATLRDTEGEDFMFPQTQMFTVIYTLILKINFILKSDPAPSSPHLCLFTKVWMIFLFYLYFQAQ